MGRALAAAMCRVAFARGARRLRGEYRRTARNAPAAEFYHEVGFSAVHSDGERSVWRLTLPAPAELTPHWIMLRFDWDEA